MGTYWTAQGAIYSASLGGLDKKESKAEGTHVNMGLLRFVVQQKLARCCCCC